MITLYVLLVMTMSVLGNLDLEKVCPSYICSPQYPSKYSNKAAPKVKAIVLYHGSDLELVQVTPNLINLQVERCSSDFKMDILPQLPALKEILITKCSITELQNYQFENVNNLNSLKLYENSIEILSHNTFHKLSHLRELYLENNLIRAIPEGVFDPLESVERLNLSYNNISILPSDTFLQNRKLQMISLSGNPLKTVSLDFHLSISTFTELHLSDCGILRDLRLSIKEAALYLKNSGVERLQINGSIQEIHHENSKVTRANLSRTYFARSFVHALCDMPSIEELYLDSVTLYDSSYFELQKNGKVCKFPNLRSLSLSGNEIGDISERLPFFGPNLTTLDLSQNSLDDEMLSDLFSLDTSKVEEISFPNLRFLHMARNKLKRIPRNFPLFGPSLTVLDLSYNLLEDVSLESLAKANNLQNLSLEGNRLTSFEYISVCNGLKNLKRLALYDNMFNATFYRNMTKYLGNNGLQLT